jgi:hypothetical protein
MLMSTSTGRFINCFTEGLNRLQAVTTIHRSIKPRTDWQRKITGAQKSLWNALIRCANLNRVQCGRVRGWRMANAVA